MKIRISLLVFLAGLLVACGVAHCRLIIAQNRTNQDLTIRSICNGCGDDSNPALIKPEEFFVWSAKSDPHHLDINGIYEVDGFGRKTDKKYNETGYLYVPDLEDAKTEGWGQFYIIWFENPDPDNLAPSVANKGILRAGSWSTYNPKKAF